MGRLNNFDALRLFAAIVVVLAHMESLSGRPDSFAFGNEPMGISGVLIFFAISGYLVTGSWRADPDLGRFLAKRFLRLVPALAVAVPLTYLVVMAIGIEGFPGNRFSTLNGSLWTITIEVQCYIFLALTMLVTTRFGPAMFAAVAAAGVVALSGSYLTLFALAFSVGALLKEYPRLMRWSWAVSGLGLAIYPEHPPVALALIIAPLSVWVGTRSWPVLRNTGRFGDISYGTYIYAYPVQQSVVYFMGDHTSLVILLLVSLSIILPIAWVSWRYIERPAMHKKHEITPGNLPVKQDY
jgi:peptidoglycan/LPS O-acetylase OafA/YrhL